MATMDYRNPRSWDISKPDICKRVNRIDLVLNFLLFTPLIVLHYHSTTYLVECVFLRYFPSIGPTILFIFGAGVEFCLAFYQKKIPNYVKKGGADRQGRLTTFSWRLYTFVLTFANICHIRAVMGLYEQMTSCSAGSALRAAVTGVLVLWGMRAGRNIMGPPLFLSLDKPAEPDHYRFTTLFNSQADESQESAMDIAVTVGVVHTCIHLHWIGVTNLLDHVVFPGRPGMSSLSSMALGYGLCLFIIFYGLNKAKQFSKECEKESEMKQIAFEDFCTLLAGFAVISVWRGIWMWFDLLATKFPIYFLHRDVTPLVGCVASYLLIAMAKLTNSLPYKGCEIDGVIKDGEGLDCCTDYFMEFVREMRKEKEEKKKESNSSKTNKNNNSDEITENLGAQNPMTSQVKEMPKVRRRRVRAIEHAYNIAKNTSTLNGTVNYDLSDEDFNISETDM